MSAPHSNLKDRVIAEQKRLSDQLAQGAEAAFSRQGLIQKTFRINGQNFTLRFAGKELANAMTRALEHLAIESTKDVALTIDCWDSASTSVACPTPDWPESLFTSRGDIRGLDNPGMRIAYFNWLRLLNVYFPEKGRAYYCMAEANPFPIQQFGSPALTIFSWWFKTLGWQFTHAAAVGTDRGGVLIAGHGGAGKSTLAFSTLGTPLRYLSDDYCVLVPETPPKVMALYNSGKLTDTSLALLPSLRNRTANGQDSQREKAIFFLHEQFPSEQLFQTPLRAIVLSVLDSRETSLTQIGPHEILSVVGHSTMVQLAGSSNTDFFRINKLIHSLPNYRLRHGSDRAATHKLLLHLCES